MQIDQAHQNEYFGKSKKSLSTISIHGVDEQFHSAKGWENQHKEGF